MGASVNKHIILGRVGQDPKRSMTPSGTPVLDFSVATDSGHKDKATGEWKNETYWHNVKVYGKPVDYLTGKIMKGQQVFVEGESRTNKYEKDGTTRYFTSVFANKVELLGVNSSGPEVYPKEKVEAMSQAVSEPQGIFGEFNG